MNAFPLQPLAPPLLACFLALAVACGPASEQREEPPAIERVHGVDRAETAVTRIVVRAPPTPAWDEVVDVEHDYPTLAGEPTTGSISVGDTSDGFLVRGKPLPLGAHHAVLDIHFGRGLRFGTDELIDTITSAAGWVADTYPGSMLFVGNVGRPDGGDIPWSVSHNNGRDADLAYYSTNPFGWQTRPPDLLHFERDLRSREHYGFYRFDTPRNAELALGLAKAPSSDIQYLFTASYLERAMLAYHKANGLGLGEFSQLASALHEPRGALPHDDHLHMRVFCSGEDVCGGCVNTGVARDWARDTSGLRAQCVERITRVAARDEDPDQRARALRRLALAGDRALRLPVERGLDDPDPRVRVAAVDSLRVFGDTATVATLAEHLPNETDISVFCAMATSLDGIRRPGVVDLLTGLLSKQGTCTTQTGVLPLSALVAKALEDSEDRDAVEPLLTLLDDPHTAVREAAAAALRKITNREEGVDWSSATEAEIDAATQRWASWYADQQRRDRGTWLVAGFQTAGYGVRRLDTDSIRGLLEAVRGPEYISYNAQRVLMRIAEKYPPSLSWSTEDAAWYWTRYFKKRQDQFGIDLSDVPERP